MLTEIVRSDELPPVHPNLARLAGTPGVVVLERNLAQLGFSASRLGATQRNEDSLDLGYLHDHEALAIYAAGAPSVRDHVVFLPALLRRYIDEGCPDDRTLVASEAQLTQYAGYTQGGRQSRYVKPALRRLAGTFINAAVENGGAPVAWGLLDSFRRVKGGWEVVLSRPLAALVRSDSLVWLNRSMLLQMMQASARCARLWVFLESEKLGPAPHSYTLRRAAARHQPSLAEILDMRWAAQRNCAQAVDAAFAQVCGLDPRYACRPARAKASGYRRYDVTRSLGSPSPPGGHIDWDALLPRASGCTSMCTEMQKRGQGTKYSRGQRDVPSDTQGCTSGYGDGWETAANGPEIGPTQTALQTGTSNRSERDRAEARCEEHDFRGCPALDVLLGQSSPLSEAFPGVNRSRQMQAMARDICRALNRIAYGLPALERAAFCRETAQCQSDKLLAANAAKPIENPGAYIAQMRRNYGDGPFTEEQVERVRCARRSRPRESTEGVTRIGDIMRKARE